VNGINRDRFLRVHEKRVNNALKAIRLVGNCFDHTNYAYSLSEAQNIIEALRQSISDIEQRIHPHRPQVSISYSHLVNQKHHDDEFMVNDESCDQHTVINDYFNSFL
jgi:uncharacterized protein YeeX (DUF496 family)